MLEMAKRIGLQVAVIAAVLMVTLLLARIFTPKTGLGLMILTLALTLIALYVASSGIATRLWWGYMFLWTLGLLALWIGELFVFESLEPNTVGPGAIIYILPLMTMFFTFPVSGLIHLFTYKPSAGSSQDPSATK
jgi:hypothetical protein